MCKVLGVLPEAGGLLDQRAELITHMQLVMIAEQKKFEQEKKKAEIKRGTRNPRN